jgi:hypothetical protein
MPAERKLDNTGKRLGQWLQLARPFTALWVPISAWGTADVNGLALWPFNLTLMDAAGKIVAAASVSDINVIAPRKPSPINSNWVRLVAAAPASTTTSSSDGGGSGGIGSRLVPAGRYLLTMTAQSILNRTQQNGFYNGVGWLTDAIPVRKNDTSHAAGAGAEVGAVSATYSLAQLQVRSLKRWIRSYKTKR